MMLAHCIVKINSTVQPVRQKRTSHLREFSIVVLAIILYVWIA
jgi:hypothetical protein